MGGLYSRVKTWVSLEDVTHTDLNAEFDNVLTNFVPLMIDDYSTDVTQMQVTADPGELASESKATTLAGELARLRHMIKEITGKSYWYQSPADSLSGLAAAIGTSVSVNRLVSGRIRSTSDQPIFLVPHGAARTVTCKGATTNFLYYVEGTQYTISSDVTLTSLTAAPSSNNTALINDASAADQDWTKYQGEDGSIIPIDNIGSEITALVGKYAAFKLAGVGTEYFIARVETDYLSCAFRGYFFDSSDNPITRTGYTNNDTLTLMKLAWIFAKSDGTLTVSYTNPVWSKDEPSSPATGDYWYDYDNVKWKKYDTSSFIDADATLIGVCIQDTTNTVGARSFEFFKSWSEENSIEAVFNSNTQVQSKWVGSGISVYGDVFRNERSRFSWDITTDLESGVSENPSTTYYLYVSEDGESFISDQKPYDRREDLLGYYHPYQSWRCVGSFFNNASSNITSVSTYFSRIGDASLSEPQTAASGIIFLERTQILDGSGGAFTKVLPPAALWRGNRITFVRADQTLANQITLDFYGSEAQVSPVGSKTTYKLCTKGESVTLMSDGTNIYVVGQYIPGDTIANGVIAIGATTSAPTKASGIGIDRMLWCRRKDRLHGFFEYQQTNTTSSAAGSGDYLFGALPTGLTIDTAKVTVYATVEGAGAWVNKNNVGPADIGGGASNLVGCVSVYDTTQVRIFALNAAGGGAIGSGYFGTNSTDYHICANYSVPITGWEA